MPGGLAQGSAAAEGLRGRQAAPEEAEETSTSGGLTSPSTDSSPVSSPSWVTTWEDVETMRRASDDMDDGDDAESILNWSVGSGVVARGPQLVRALSPTPAGPFNSTMVEGGVPIQDMPLPTIPLGASSGGMVRPAAGPERPPPEDDATLSRLNAPNPVPPCPLGLLRGMQLELMREAGVTCSWDLPE